MASIGWMKQSGPKLIKEMSFYHNVQLKTYGEILYIIVK
jgi:hypothetical protein